MGLKGGGGHVVGLGGRGGDFQQGGAEVGPWGPWGEWWGL